MVVAQDNSMSSKGFWKNVRFAEGNSTQILMKSMLGSAKKYSWKKEGSSVVKGKEVDQNSPTKNDVLNCTIFNQLC